jgi:hypothetical protein
MRVFPTLMAFVSRHCAGFEEGDDANQFSPGMPQCKRRKVSSHTTDASNPADLAGAE